MKEHPSVKAAEKQAAAQASKAALAHLLQEVVGGEKVNWEKQPIDIERTGRKITLPNEPGPMPIQTAIDALERLKYDEEQETTVDEQIVAYPLEAAVAFVAAMEELYGWASPVPTPGFFGPRPPHFVTVNVGVNEFIQVPWGSFRIPGVENAIQIGADRDSRGQMILRVFGSVRKRERHVLLELANKTREILRERSIYRGKAIHVTTDYDGELDLNNPPTFIDLAGVNPSELIMNADVQNQIDVSILAPIKHTARVRSAGIPLKRGVLLEGRYGVGKTMTNRVVAKTCVDNGWTFIAIDRAASLAEALAFAQRYQPAVIFCEDVDRATSTRDETANDLLNTIDGILSKDAEVMVVLTTNHVENIEPAMLRPGRLDAVISVTPPDSDSVARLIRLYSRGLLDGNEDLTQVGAELAGNIPAVVREVVERSKLAMIAAGREKITQDDLLIAARGMNAHLQLLAPRQPVISDEEAAGKALKKLFSPQELPDDLATASDVERMADATARPMGEIQEALAAGIKASKRNGKLMEQIGEQVDEIHSATC